MEDILKFLAEYPLAIAVLSSLGGLVVLGQAIIAITPSKADDDWYSAVKEKAIIGHILKFLESFAPIQKK